MLIAKSLCLLIAKSLCMLIAAKSLCMLIAAKSLCMLIAARQRTGRLNIILKQVCSTKYFGAVYLLDKLMWTKFLVELEGSFLLY